MVSLNYLFKNFYYQLRIVCNYVRTTPLDMVCRGADRDLLYKENDFKLQVPQEYELSPVQQVENQKPNTSSVSRFEPSQVMQESRNENINHNEFGEF